ncbi:MAG: metal-sulfur cluster assembly factor [Polyangiaceae bacterium]|nr:metal-sulfur cluster assembly factor [Polyangiaceae bacterium]
MTDGETLARAEAALGEVIDPEVGLDVVNLGLVYEIYVGDGVVCVRLTMTTPACPLSGEIVRDAEERLRAIPGVRSARVELVWEPPWSPERMTPHAKALLGWSPA